MQDGRPSSAARDMSRTRIAVGALVCGLFAATYVPGGPPGAGILVAAMGVTAVVVSARPTSRSLHTVFCLALSLALASLSVLRAAGWVIVFDLLGAITLASSAVAGGVTWSGVARGGIAVWAGLSRGLSFALTPVRDSLSRLPRGRSRPALRGLLIGGLLVAPFGVLFASADRAFLELASQALAPDVETSLLPVRVFLLLFVPALVGAYVLIGPRHSPPVDDPEGSFASRPDPPAIGVAEWSVSLVLLNLLFGFFVIVQLTVLFGGRHHVLETTGLTYAQYARQGFFQLILVALLTFAVVGGAAHWARTTSPSQNILLRVLLGLLCVLTLVVLASALRRLVLYEETYGFTRLRISVHATILWIGALFALVLTALATWRGSWLPRAFLYVGGVGLLAFSLVNPEGIIARQNVSRYEETGSIDIAYLQTLSPDAVEGLGRLRPDLRQCVYGAIALHLPPEAPWQYFNLARNAAAEDLAAAEAQEVACDSALARGPAPSPAGG